MSASAWVLLVALWAAGTAAAYAVAAYWYRYWKQAQERRVARALAKGWRMGFDEGKQSGARAVGVDRLPRKMDATAIEAWTDDDSGPTGF